MKRSLQLLLLLAILFSSCKNNNDQKQQESAQTIEDTTATPPFFKISLAEWSLHDPITKGELSPMDFAQKASEMGFEGIEYVSQLYTNELSNYADQSTAMDSLVKTLKEKSEQYGVKNILIMVDNEGDLAAADDNLRKEAVKKHKKWVDAAATLGCHAVRVNLNGVQDEQQWKDASVDGLTQLADYAADKNIEVLVENHGGFSSNAVLLMDVMNRVDRENCGTLPDFGNFCITRSENGCAKEYPRYEGIAQMMPKAMAVSAKTFTFDENGEEATMDYKKIMQTVKDAGYTGFVGIEYEGDQLSPEEGIIKTRELLLNTAKKLN